MKRISHILKHTFIPHEHNDYRPHFFREFFIGVILVVSLVLFTVSLGSAFVLQNTDAGTSIIANVLIDLTNKDRLSNGVSTLVHSDILEKAASMKAQDMALKSYFSHTSPEGINPWYWFKQVGYTFLYAGENLAINFTESSQIEEAWMASPTHKANILDKRFREIGISTTDGVYKDRITTYVVQLFGTPAITLETTIKQDDVTSLNSSSTIITQVNNSNNTGKVLSSTKDTIPVTEISKEEMFTLIVSSPTVVAVKNNQNVEEIATTGVIPQNYSSWYERLIFNMPNYVDTILIIISGIICIALLLLIVIEIEKQHPKHIAYGVCTLSVLIVLMYINKEMFIQHFVFLF